MNNQFETGQASYRLKAVQVNATSLNVTCATLARHVLFTCCLSQGHREYTKSGMDQWLFKAVILNVP